MTPLILSTSDTPDVVRAKMEAHINDLYCRVRELEARELNANGLRSRLIQVERERDRLRSIECLLRLCLRDLNSMNEDLRERLSDMESLSQLELAFKAI